MRVKRLFEPILKLASVLKMKYNEFALVIGGKYGKETNKKTAKIRRE
jgi:hypothetical protein